jgi:hypothetical protein
MDAHTELEQLVAELLDSSPDPDRNRRLCELLREHPHLQQEYLDHLQLHALLHWRGGTVVPAASPAAAAETIPLRPRRKRMWRVLAAALLFLAAGVGLWLLVLAPEKPSPDVVESLVDWNLDLSQARSLEVRQEIYDSRVETMRAMLSQTALPAEDRDLAETLLETGSWLTRNDDPAAEAERFSDLADQLVARLDAAAAAKDSRRITKLADTYSRLAEVGVSSNLERAIAVRPTTPHRKVKLERTIASDARRARKLEELAEQNPEPSRKAFHRALKPHRRHKNGPPKPGE